MEDKVSKEVATKEIDALLDSLDVPKETREFGTVKPYVDSLINSVMKGRLIINDNETVTQKLIHPLADGATTEIEYDFRFEIGAYNSKTKGTTSDKEIEWIVARLSLLSIKELPTTVFMKMKRADYHVAKALTVFF